MKKYHFDQVVEDCTSKFHKIKKEDYLQIGQYKIVDQGKEFIAGYTNNKELVNILSSPIIIFGDHTRIFKYVDFPLALGADGAKALSIKNNLADGKYLYYYLKTLRITDAGYSRHFKFLKEASILLPENYDDQIRIAKILIRAESLIVKRKESIKALDELLKSVFLEMFGDPVRNEKGWERVIIRDLIKEAKYGTSKSAEGGKYKYLRMNNITNEGYWNFSNLKYIEIEDSEKEKYVLKKNDLVFNRTNSKELVGKTAVYSSDEEVIIAGYLIRVRTKTNVNPWYIWGYLNSKAGKLRLFNLCRNIVGMANINAQELQDIPILKPPLPLQNQFAAIVEKVESLKSKYTKNLTELENLYGSLSQRAFKGELDLNGVDIGNDGIGCHCEHSEVI